MKKLKLLLTLAVVAILAAGVLVGCTTQFEIDPNETPHKVTYCSNGGTIEKKTELYFYHPEGGLINEPTTDGIVENAVRVGYSLVGWAKADVNPDGTPVLLDEPLYPHDGGVWMSQDGAISEDQFAEAGKLGYTLEKKYYSYDERNLFDFSGAYATEDVVLVAVWGMYNRFMVVDKDENGDWVDFSELYAVNGDEVTNIVTTDEAILEKYKGNLTDISNATGVINRKQLVDNVYNVVREGYTAIRYFLDEACTVELTFPYTATKPLTPIYYTELEGEYSIVTNAKQFSDAVKADANIYLLNDIDFDGATVDNSRKYTAIFDGNNKKLTNISVTVQQTVCKEGAQNVYGGLFGTVDGATIKNVEIDIAVTFEIGVDPAEGNYGMYTPFEDQGTERDAVCYVGMLAGALKGEYSISGVTINAAYAITRSIIDGDMVFDDESGDWITDMFENEYEVTVNFADWQGIDVENDDKITDSSVVWAEAEEPEVDAE